MDTGKQVTSKSPPTIKVIFAFAIVYIVWGSTYYFIKEALAGFPPFILGAFRFIVAGLLILIYAAAKGEKVFDKKLMPRAAASGILMLFLGNGMVIWVEQFLSSAMAAIMVSSAAFWFVILDRPKWKINFSNTNIIIGLIVGFFGVILLFWDKLSGANFRHDKEALGMQLPALVGHPKRNRGDGNAWCRALRLLESPSKHTEALYQKARP